MTSAKSFNGGNGGGDGDRVARPPDSSMFGPPDRVAPAPEPEMFGPPTDLVAPPPDAATLPSRFQPIEIETPKSESFSGPTPGGPGSDGLPPGSLPYELHTMQAQERSMKDDRGMVTVFLSDLPQK